MHWDVVDAWYGVLLSCVSGAGIGLFPWAAGGSPFCCVAGDVLLALAFIVGVVTSGDAIAADSVVPLCVGGRGDNDKLVGFEASEPGVPEPSRRAGISVTADGPGG